MKCKGCEREKFERENPDTLMNCKSVVHTCSQPERTSPEDYRKIQIDHLNEILDDPQKEILNSMVCDVPNCTNT